MKATSKRIQRIDAFLKEILEEEGYSLSKNLIKTLFEEEAILVNNKLCKKPGYSLRLDASVEINEEKLSELVSKTKLSPDLFKEQSELTRDALLVYEDESIFALDKPPCMHTVRQLNTKELCLSDAAAFLFKEAAGSSINEFDGGAINRIDYFTSGLVLFAKNKEAWAEYHQLFLAKEKQDSVQKTYHALVEGQADFRETELEHSLIHKKGTKKVIIRDFSEKNAARLKINLLKVFSSFSLIEIKAEHLSRHQIRAQLAYYGFALVGDKLYGASSSLSEIRDEVEKAEFIKKAGYLEYKKERLDELYGQGFYLRAEELKLSGKNSLHIKL